MNEDRSRAINRITALIDRAAHEGTPEEEARTCALMACKQIKQHGLAVGTLFRPNGANGYAAPPPYNEPPPQQRYVHCPVCGVVKMAGLRCEVCDRNDAEAAREAAKKREQSKVNYRTSRSGGQTFKQITSTFTSKCKSCGNLYREGDQVAWSRGNGATHWDCREYWSRV